MSTIKEALQVMLSGQEHICNQQGLILEEVRAIRKWQVDHDRTHQAMAEAECARSEATADQRKKCAKRFDRIDQAIAAAAGVVDGS